MAVGPVLLSELLEKAGVRHSTSFGSDPFIESIESDSRRVTRGSLFVCEPSASRDTHEFLDQAKEAGAVAAIVHSAEGWQRAHGIGLAAVGIAPEGQAFHFAVGRICATFYRETCHDLEIVGITGTNGKTSTAWIVRHALEAAGHRAAYLGTLGLAYGQQTTTLENTTPFPVELWKRIVEVAEAGCETLVMEASSHALYQRRLAGVSFSVGVFTNLSQDHLDFHGDMESYESAKKLLFTEYAAASVKDFAAVLNISDEVARRWMPDLPVPVFTYGSPEAMIAVEGKDVAVDGLTLVSASGGEVRMRLGGSYNVENARAAVATLAALGYEVDEALPLLAEVPPVPGRFEAVPNQRGFGILVDYAHTPDALEALLRSVRELGPRRVVTVFGCGGDRDRNKRPKMARAASAHSDLTVVTSDNPRTEEPEAIIAEILPGIAPGKQVETYTDRAEAIRFAVHAAEPGDVVVIAGKGHEDYQIIGREKFPMSDREMALEALAMEPTRP